STLGRDGAAWSASSDQDWLEVTASGGTGGALTLTANPLLLAADTLHVAQVSIASDDPLIENTQGIRVGLWIGSADPGVIALPDGIERTVMDPVAPWLYAHSGADLVSVYNVYTGELVTSYAAGTSAPGGMAASSDGLKLFVADTATGQAFELSAADGTPVQTYTPPFQTANADLAYARPDALPTLLFGNTYAADAATGEFFEAQLGGSGTIAVAADQRVVFLHNTGTSPSTATRQELRRTVLDGGALRVENRADFFPGSNGQDAALAPDGARFYAASGGYYAFPVYDGVTREFIEDLAGAAYPNNAEVAWNGVFAGGASAYYDAVDLWFYDAAGAVLGTERCFGSSYSWLVRDSIRFSGDALRYACSAGPDVWGEGATLRIRDVPGS
ncbi:MAG: YncE family protein, partial [Nevskiaceae bacterium]